MVRAGDDDKMPMVTALVRTAFLVDAVYAQAAREHGVTAQQGQLLCVLMAQPLGMSDLGTMLGLAKSSLTGLVDRSERRGYVERVPDPSDGRAVRVALTSSGASLAETFYDDTCARLAELAARLSATEQGRLAGLLARVVEANEVPAVFE